MCKYVSEDIAGARVILPLKCKNKARKKKKKNLVGFNAKQCSVFLDYKVKFEKAPNNQNYKYLSLEKR